MLKLTKWIAGIVAAIAFSLGFAQAAEDKPAADPLSSIFIEGQGWEPAVQNLGFADGSSPDAKGNLYFSDLNKKAPAVYQLSPDGKQTKLADVGMSGTKIGPDGKLYGVGGGKAMVFELPGGKSTVLAEGLKTNDLVVTHAGYIYITETSKHQVTLLDPRTGKVSPADVGIKAPNGIGVTPDQSHLLVSDYGGLNVWSFAIAADGTLSDKRAVMTMKALEKKPTVAGGDGLTLDVQGRVYVTTALGLQIFSADGQWLGLVAKPQNAPLTNAAFAGENRQYLYVTCGNTVFRRKTQVKGALNFEAAGK